VSDLRAARARHAALCRHDPHGDAAVHAARDLTEARLTAQTRAALAADPPLTPEQRRRIARLLLGDLTPLPVLTMTARESDHDGPTSSNGERP
jgi:hypothetical protein